MRTSDALASAAASVRRTLQRQRVRDFGWKGIVIPSVQCSRNLSLRDVVLGRSFIQPGEGARPCFLSDISGAVNGLGGREKQQGGEMRLVSSW